MDQVFRQMGQQINALMETILGMADNAINAGLSKAGDGLAGISEGAGRVFGNVRETLLGAAASVAPTRGADFAPVREPQLAQAVQHDIHHFNPQDLGGLSSPTFGAIQRSGAGLGV